MVAPGGAGGFPGNKKNDMSIAVRIDYGETSFIITGDAEWTSEFMMADTGLPLRADVLQVGHHGSSTSTTEEFLENVKPHYAVISCGAGNQYGHPHQATLDKLWHIPFYTADLQGTIIARSDGKTITFETERETTEDVYVSPGSANEDYGK